MKKFEYLVTTQNIIDVSDYNMTEILNRFGTDGWELVQFDLIPSSTEVVYTFKRELENYLTAI